MRFITITLIVHAPDPRTGEQKSTQQRFREVIGGGPIDDGAVPARAVTATG